MNRKSLTPFLAALFGLGLALPAWSAPLFPDVPQDMWARDAVATLAAKGLVEGYPDGTFKGDRNASRWEVAQVVARLLAQLENEHATLATKAELAELEKLSQALQGELQALGARTKTLEEKVLNLDQRVNELERITFYGEYQARLHTMSLRNVGLAALGDPPILDYNEMVGSNSGAGGPLLPPSIAAGTAFNTFVFGIASVTDWSTGRPMVSGRSLAQRLMLGTNFQLSEDFEGGAEFSAYSSAGNNVMDAFWGVSQPYLSNPFTSSVGTLASTQGLDHKPYTKLSLDNFWLRHTPSNTSLVVGAFDEQNFSSQVYVPQRNPNAWGDYYLSSYGLQLKGESDLAPDWQLKWEVMGTRLANGVSNSVFTDDAYLSRAEGLNAEVSYKEGAGSFKVNLLHASEDGYQGKAKAGLHWQENFTLNWVNPNGYYINQLGMGAPAVSGMGTTSDKRPIAMLPTAGNDGITGVTGVPNVGGIGPQDMLTYGFSANYEFDLGSFKPEIYADYAHSDYKPSKNSDYSVGGDAYRVGANLSMFDDVLTISGNYTHTDPTYDPFVLAYPTINGIGNTLWNVPGFTYYNSLYSLHDTETFTHNRRGWRAQVDWRFCRTGLISFQYRDLEQVRTSCQDVRYGANALGMGSPNTPVLGFSPGFMDPVFGGFSMETFAPEGDNALGKVLENPRGKSTNWSLTAGFKYPLEPKKNKRCLSISGGARSTHFTRHSQLASLIDSPTRFGSESQNYVNFYLDAWQINLDYDITTNLRLHTGYKSVDMYGHLDHLGVMNAYANHIGSSNFDVINLEQRIPNISIEWDISDQMTWGALGQFFNTKDRMKEDIFASPGIPAMNLDYGPQKGAHPFNWQGYMVSTYLNFKF